ncbi:MAG: hypothetical protein ACR2PA_17345, partial [Hyphomicrobiaceae bacterium]
LERPSDSRLSIWCEESDTEHPWEIDITCRNPATISPLYEHHARHFRAGPVNAGQSSTETEAATHKAVGQNINSRDAVSAAGRAGHKVQPELH